MNASVNRKSRLGNCRVQDVAASLPLADMRGRVVRYLRFSVTDRCNLRCLYCSSNARHSFIPHENVLRYEEMLRMVGAMQRLGVQKVRLTGGEPFARKGCGDFLVMLRRHFPDLDLRITTNGTLLSQNLDALYEARVSAVNLSLDSFDRQTFAHVTGRDLLPSVLGALDSLLTAGIRVKINAVGLRTINDGQMADFVYAARTLPVDVRFIEFMPMGGDTLWSNDYFWSADDMLEAARACTALTPLAPEPGNAGPARMYALPGGLGRLGFITPMSNHFCNECNRLRITSDGHLRTCLFADREYRLRSLFRHPRLNDAALDRVVQAACRRKPLGADILKARRGAAVATRAMWGIGG